MTKRVLHVKIAERVLIVILIAIGFLAYRSPTFLSYISTETIPPHVLVLFLASVITFAHFYSENESRRVLRYEVKRKELKD